MNKKYFKIVIFIVSFSLIGLQGYCQLKKDSPIQSKQGKFSKRAFSSDNTDGSTDPIIQGAPGPGGGTGGFPAPISNGLFLLIIGSSVYLSAKLNKEIKNK